jgi:hypothetical protein
MRSAIFTKPVSFWRMVCNQKLLTCPHTGFGGFIEDQSAEKETRNRFSFNGFTLMGRCISSEPENQRIRLKPLPWGTGGVGKHPWTDQDDRLMADWLQQAIMDTTVDGPSDSTGSVSSTIFTACTRALGLPVPCALQR